MIGRVYALQLQHEANSATDTPPSAPIVDVITEYLYQDIIEDLQTLIFDQVHQDCEGCKVNHPSQLRHQLCLFTSTEDWVDFYLDLALETLDLDKVMERWYPQIEQTEASPSDRKVAFQLWEGIKQDFQSKLSDNSWKDQWGSRVKEAWNPVPKSNLKRLFIRKSHH